MGNSPYPLNGGGFTIPSATPAARPEVGCVIHLHTEAGMALSMLEGGLLPLSQTAMFFHRNIALPDYERIALNLEERERLTRDLGDNAGMSLRQHRTVDARRSI